MLLVWTRVRTPPSPRYRGKDATMKECPKLFDFGHSCVTASTNGYAVKDAAMKASTNGYPVKDAVMHETINGNPVKVSCIAGVNTTILVLTFCIAGVNTAILVLTFCISKSFFANLSNYLPSSIISPKSLIFI